MSGEYLITITNLSTLNSLVSSKKIFCPVSDFPENISSSDAVVLFKKITPRIKLECIIMSVTVLLINAFIPTNQVVGQIHL